MVDFNRVWSSAGSIATPGVDEVEDGHGTIVPPDNQTENFWKNRADLALQMAQRSGAMEWDNDVPYLAGVTVTQGGAYYFCKTANTGSSPSISPSLWEQVDAPSLRAATESYPGAARKATAAQLLAGMADRYADGAAFLSAFTGSNRALNTNGYQRLPGGFIIQWGAAVAQPTGSVVYSYPIAFPNGYLCGSAQVAKTFSTDAGVRHINITLSTFGLDTSNTINTDAEWFAIGF